MEKDDTFHRCWLLDGKTIAREIRTSGLPSVHTVKDREANWECPHCGFRIDNCNVSNEWPGLPSGVKFDPSDVELLDHLAAKYGVGDDKPHEYIDIFIPTLDEAEGICYQHPENLPGARKDGNSIHFFYRTTNAYNKGQRKRRKINNGSNIRWHKTGKTKAILKNGVQIGFKKIMVLYGTDLEGSKSKPFNLNWVMHQFHLGTNEDEKDGDFVVSKIFYQTQKQIENTCDRVMVEEADQLTNPKTPKTDAPKPPCPGKTPLYEDVTFDYALDPQVSECFEQKYHPSLSSVDAPRVARHASTSLGITDHENLDLGSSPHFNLAVILASRHLTLQKEQGLVFSM